MSWSSSQVSSRTLILTRLPLPSPVTNRRSPGVRVAGTTRIHWSGSWTMAALNDLVICFRRLGLLVGNPSGKNLNWKMILLSSTS